jgi:hypothetical protein
VRVHIGANGPSSSRNLENAVFPPKDQRAMGTQQRSDESSRRRVICIAYFCCFGGSLSWITLYLLVLPEFCLQGGNDHSNGQSDGGGREGGKGTPEAIIDALTLEEHLAIGIVNKEFATNPVSKVGKVFIVMRTLQSVRGMIMS